MLRALVSITFALAFFTLLSGCGGGTGSTNGASGKTNESGPAKANKKVIAVIPKSTTHEFWGHVREGAESAAKDHNVEIIFKAGDPGDQPEAQLTLVKQMIAQHVDAIVLAPVNAKFLAPAVDDAAEAKIPLVVIDSAIDAPWDKYAAYVATDNRDGGAQCAKKLAEAMGGKGTVLLFGYMEGSASTMEREAGFKDYLAKNNPEIKIIQEKYAGATHVDALKNANDLLAANPVFDGVFASNESSATGMLTALEDKKLLGKVKYVGFDTTQKLLGAIEKGDMVAVAAQNPFQIGSDGVALAISVLEGKKIEVHDIVIGAEMVTRETLQNESLLKKQREEEQKREAELKRLKEENERQVEEQRKKIEAEQKNSQTK